LAGFESGGLIGRTFQTLKRRVAAKFVMVAGGSADAYPGPQTARGQSMTDDEILAEFRAAEALLEGHFILSSGLRSPRYLQCARVLMDAARASRLAGALAAKLSPELRETIDAVVSPAMGGVIIGHEMGRALGCKAMFVERPHGAFGLRRGFRLEPGTRVLMVEDVVTTGLSSREAIAAIEAAGGKVIAAASLVDRSGGSADLGVPFTPLIRIDVPTYSADDLPRDLATIPATKPGSRAEPAGAPQGA
jgi:orotate phosphoribosyltransferase